MTDYHAIPNRCGVCDGPMLGAHYHESDAETCRRYCYAGHSVCGQEDCTAREGPRIYRIIRFRFNGAPRTIKTGLTLAEAQRHCDDPQTSSRTRTKGRRIPGTWFDGYDYMRGCKPRGRG